MTGRSVVVFRQTGDATKTGVASINNALGVHLAHTSDAASGALSAADVEQAGGVVLQNLNAAIVRASVPRIASAGAAAAAQGAIEAVIPVGPLFALNWYRRVREAGVTKLGTTAFSPEYQRGFRDGVLSMTAADLPTGPVGASSAQAVWDERQATWGLQATGAAASALTGTGVKVAILDTGLDLGHPDFHVPADHQLSFVPNVPGVQDGNGHGTHVAGTACGPRTPTSLPRYGIAGDAELYIGKVLGDDGVGYDDWFLAALDWAITNKCRVVNMSLGRPPTDHYDAGFETLAKRALDAGTLIIAAAGNDAHNDFNHPAPVSHPADCPSIMAVAAIDQDCQVAWFSNSSFTGNGGQIDLAGPGVAVRSSWPAPKLNALDDGTSMATPHVTGIAALIAQANATMDARALWATLAQSAKRLGAESKFVGAGLVQIA
jgi:subtilisin family serine protease